MSPSSEGLKSQNNNRSSSICDVVTISTSSVPEDTTTYSKPITAKADEEQLLPENCSYLDLDKMSKQIKKVKNDEDLLDVLVTVNDLDEAKEILKYFKDNNKISPIVKGITRILSYYNEDEIEKCGYLKTDFNLKIRQEGRATYNIDSRSYTAEYKRVRYKDPLDTLFAVRMYSKLKVSFIAFKNNNIDILDKIFRHLLTKADSYLKFTASNKKAYDQAIFQLWSVIDFVKPEYQNHITKNEEVAYGASKVLVYNNAINEAQKFISQVLANAGPQSDKRCIGEHLFNMGKILGKQRNFPGSLKYFLQAYDNLPGDIMVLENLIAAAGANGKLNVAVDAVEKLPSKDKDLKTLLLASFCLYGQDRSKTISIIKGMKESDIPEVFHEILYSMKFIIDKDRELLKEGTINKLSFLKGIKLLEDKKVDDTLLFFICIRFNQQEAARGIMQAIDDETIKTIPILQKFKVLLQNDKITNLVDEIESYHLGPQEKAELHFDAASACIVQGELEEAGKHLVTAIELEPENQTYIEANLLRTILSNETANLQDYRSKIDQEAQEEILAEFRSTPNISEEISTKEEQVDEPFIELDPKKIHDHFQRIKAQRLVSLSQTAIFGNQSKKWNIGDQTIDSEQAISLGERRGLQYYGYIEPKLSASLREHCELLSNALSKGFIKRSYGNNGVKFLQGKAIELKINADLRLFTNKVYVNRHKERLIIFEHSGNHAEVKKFAASSSIFYVEQ